MRVLSIIFTLLFLLLFLGRKKEDGQRDRGFFEKSLLSAYRVFNVNPNIVGSKTLKSAPAAWVPALRISVYADRFERVDYCLLVKAPLDLDPGQIKFTKAKIEEECEDVLFKKPASDIKDFYNIAVDYAEGRLSLKMDERLYLYSLHNLKKSAVKISFPEKGAAERLELLKDGEVCLQVKDDCSQGQDLCGRCEGGSYHVKNSACSKSYSKVCGEDRCGGKGEYACIRGQVASGVKDYCIQDSPVGFCHGKNRVACVNKTLICE